MTLPCIWCDIVAHVSRTDMRTYCTYPKTDFILAPLFDSP